MEEYLHYFEEFPGNIFNELFKNLKSSNNKPFTIILDQSMIVQILRIYNELIDKNNELIRKYENKE